LSDPAAREPAGNRPIQTLITMAVNSEREQESGANMGVYLGRSAACGLGKKESGTFSAGDSDAVVYLSVPPPKR
jgi:hypothetical protein